MRAVLGTLARRTMWSVAAVSFVLLAACGSSNSPSAAASPTPSPSPSPSKVATGPMNACKLVTLDEASAAAKATLQDVSASAGGGAAGICIYADTSSGTAVIMFAEAYPDKSTAQSIPPSTILAALGDSVGTAKAVTGIGDQAFEYPLTTSGPGGYAIFVFKNNVMLMIAMAPSADASGVEALAKLAVGRI